MTSVPKPLKFLRPHYATLKDVHGAMADGDVRRDLADTLSVLAMTMAGPDERESLKVCAFLEVRRAASQVCGASARSLFLEEHVLNRVEV